MTLMDRVEGSLAQNLLRCLAVVVLLFKEISNLSYVGCCNFHYYFSEEITIPPD
jgi:hypothetical protein